MAVKTYEGRILHKHDTQKNWDKAVNFIPKISELIVYDADDDCAYPRLKIGDGVTKVKELPFVLYSELNSITSSVTDIFNYLYSEIETTNTSLTDVKETSNNAKDAADNAQKTADEAQKVANEAQSTAEIAKIQADANLKNINEIKNTNPDWEQIDPTALDYIKNKTHYDTRSMILDGFTDSDSASGSFNGSSAYVIKSNLDQAFSGKNLIGAIVHYRNTSITLTEENIFPINGDYTNVLVAVASPQNEMLPGLAFIGGAPTNGFYNSASFYFSSASVYRFDGFYVDVTNLKIEYPGELKQLDEKYIPSSIVERIVALENADKPVEATEDEVVAVLIDAGGLPALTVDGTPLSVDGSIITL